MAGSGRLLPAIFKALPFGATSVINTILVLGIGLLVVAACSDIRNFRIPNVLVLEVAGLALVRLGVIGDPLYAVFEIVIAALVFVIGCLLFSRGYVGGGDVKLLTATVLLTGYHDLFFLLLAMGIFGLFLSVAVILFHTFRFVDAGPRLAAMCRLPVPYGAAIAGAGIVTLLSQSSLIGYAINLG